MMQAINAKLGEDAAIFEAKDLHIPVINSKASYKEALRLMRQLREEDTKASTAKRHALAILIEDYERRSAPPPPSDPVDALDFYMALNGLNQAEFARRTRISTSRVSEIMNGHRNLSLSMIRKLHEHTRLPLATLIAKPKEK